MRVIILSHHIHHHRHHTHPHIPGPPHRPGRSDVMVATPVCMWGVGMRVLVVNSPFHHHHHTHPHIPGNLPSGLAVAAPPVCTRRTSIITTNHCHHHHPLTPLASLLRAASPIRIQMASLRAVCFVIPILLVPLRVAGLVSMVPWAPPRVASLVILIHLAGCYFHIHLPPRGRHAPQLIPQTLPSGLRCQQEAKMRKQPGNRAVVHHVGSFLEQPRSPVVLHDADCFGPPSGRPGSPDARVDRRLGLAPARLGNSCDVIKIDVMHRDEHPYVHMPYQLLHSHSFTPSFTIPEAQDVDVHDVEHCEAAWSCPEVVGSDHEGRVYP